MAHPIEESLQGLQIPFSECARVAGQCVDRLHPLESGWIVEWEIQFIVVHDVEDQDVMTGAAKSGQSFEGFFFATEEVRCDDHQAAFGVGVVDFAKDFRQVGLIGHGGLFEGSVDRLQVAAACAPGEFGADLLVEDRQANGVLLTKAHVGQAGRDRGSVIKFVEWTAAVGHAGRRVDQQSAPQVGVFFVLLDVESVLATPDFPVDVAQVVARDVLPVLNELDGLAEVGTAVHAREESFDHVSSPELHRGDAPDCFRMQIVFGIGHLAAIGLEQSAYFGSVVR